MGPMGTPSSSSSSSSSLVFPSSLASFHLDRATIRSNLRDTYNRLHSIASDAAFVASVSALYPAFQTVPNLRAGAWYVRPRSPPPATAADPAQQQQLPPRAYFKSTDGHTGETDFNLRRANLGLVDQIRSDGGIVVVDSTRRGKRFPDALSKTLPIWCAVLNRARTTLLPPSDPDNSDVPADAWAEHGQLWTLPSAVSRSEHGVIHAKVPAWAERLVNSSYDLSTLLSLRKPLRPIFVSPASVPATSPAAFDGFIPVVLVSASKLASEEDGLEREGGYTYVQGSGDDHEAWSRGLTPTLFWAHADEILSASREEIDAVIAEIVERHLSVVEHPPSSAGVDASQIRGTGVWAGFGVGDDQDEERKRERGRRVVRVSLLDQGKGVGPPSKDEEEKEARIRVKAGKAGYTMFFARLEEVLGTLEGPEAVEVRVERAPGERQGDADDLGVAVLLSLLVRVAEPSGRSWEQVGEASPRVTKPLIRTRLEWILEAFPSLNPSRAILNRVNEFLISVPAQKK